MIVSLQRKFILISAISIFVVFSGIFLVLVFFSNRQLDRTMDTLADAISFNDGVFPEFDPAQPSQPFPYDNIITEETRFSTRFFTVWVDDAGHITHINIDSVSSISEEQVEDFAQTALSEGTRRGWVSDYRYRVVETDTGSTLVFVNGTMNRSMSGRLLLTAFLVLLGSAFLILALIIIISKRVVHPVAESYEKQKQFITDAGHEIKTPLAIISANTEVLEMVSEPNQWTVSIKNQITRLNGLLKELLSLAKMEEEKPALTMADFNISDAVYDAASPFTTLAETKGKKLTIDVANGLSYHGDEGAIRQLVSILTENAVKYADEDGEIIVKLFTSHNGKETDLEVSNTCKEPPQGDLTKLFDRFYRDDSSRSRSKGEKKGGYGIGLSIAQAIVRSHKSKISCKAENGMMIFTAQLK